MLCYWYISYIVAKLLHFLDMKSIYVYLNFIDMNLSRNVFIYNVNSCTDIQDKQLQDMCLPPDVMLITASIHYKCPEVTFHEKRSMLKRLFNSAPSLHTHLLNEGLLAWEG